MIDSHCHLNFDAFDEDRDAVIARALEAGVDRIILPSVDLENADSGIRLANEHVGIYAAVGIHPTSTADFDESWLDRIAEQSHDSKVVAYGEIGLDYHWDTSPKEAQHRAFEAQLDLARRLVLPVIIHNREASDDVMAIGRPLLAQIAERNRLGDRAQSSLWIGMDEIAVASAGRLHQQIVAAIAVEVGNHGHVQIVVPRNAEMARAPDLEIALRARAVR